MRQGLRGLTIRGKSFLACAVAMALLALVFGEKDLLRVAVLIAALPLLAAWYVGRTRYTLACVRTLTPHRTPAGGTARVVLHLRNQSALPTGTLLLEDRLPYALGSRPRLVLERLGRRQASSVAYTVRAQARGRYEVGPLMVRLTDPFGLCEVNRSFPSVDRLTVVPRTEALPAGRLAGEHAGAGESRARSVAVHGDDDAATREYRHGDDLRRVHWRSTARVGELMVRREEQPWDSRATLVLDSRADAHHGEGPGASFEWAVSAIASIALRLRQSGYKLRLVTGAGVDLDANDPEGDGNLLDHLAQIRPTRRDDIPGLVHRVRRRVDGGLVIAVLGALAPVEAQVLATLRGGSTTCVGLLVDTTTWLALPPPEREAAARAHAAAGLTLLRSGWRTVDARHGDRLPALWPVAARGRPGFAVRAAMAETVTPQGGAR